MDVQGSIWKVPAGGGDAIRLTTGKYDGLNGVAATPDGHLIYGMADTGRNDLSIMDANGGENRPLFANPMIRRDPAVSPDGKHVAFLSGSSETSRMSESGPETLMIGAVDGSSSRPLGPAYAGTPAFTPDGTQLAFVSGTQAQRIIAIMPIQGGQARAVTKTSAVSPSISNDGKWLACICGISGAGLEMCVVPMSGGAPEKTFRFAYANNTIVRWSPDNKSLWFSGVVGDRSNVYEQPLDGSPPRKLTNFHELIAANFVPLPDGKSLSVVRIDLIRDAVLLTGFQ
jgi:Tol biopolymer transport system component